eukprot:scaffold92206_cov45-Phaeocystis_antarctica.AAC.1
MPSAREPETQQNADLRWQGLPEQLKSIGRGPGGAGSNHVQARSAALPKSRLLAYGLASTNQGSLGSYFKVVGATSY